MSTYSRMNAAAGAAALALVFGFFSPAQADTYLGSYVARLSERDHHASDGYALDTAAQVVRQDRAYMHKFGSNDDEDDFDPWFKTAQSRVKLERMLNKGSAMSGQTKHAIANGTPVVKVDVYANSVRVSILGY